MGESIDRLLQGVAIGAPLAGGVLEARGIRAQAASSAAADQYNARLALLEGGQDAETIRSQGSRELTRGRVQFAATSGLRLEGSPLQTLAQEASTVERNAIEREIAGRNTARLDLAKAKSTKQAAKTAAGTALLGGAISSVRSAYDLGLFRRRS